MGRLTKVKYRASSISFADARFSTNPDGKQVLKRCLKASVKNKKKNRNKKRYLKYISIRS